MTVTPARRRTDVCGRAPPAIAPALLARVQAVLTPLRSAFRRAAVPTMTAIPARRLTGVCGRDRIATGLPCPAAAETARTRQASAAGDRGSAPTAGSAAMDGAGMGSVSMGSERPWNRPKLRRSCPIRPSCRFFLFHTLLAYMVCIFCAHRAL